MLWKPSEGRDHCSWGFLKGFRTFGQIAGGQRRWGRTLQAEGNPGGLRTQPSSRQLPGLQPGDSLVSGSGEGLYKEEVHAPLDFQVQLVISKVASRCICILHPWMKSHTFRKAQYLPSLMTSHVLLLTSLSILWRALRGGMGKGYFNHLKMASMNATRKYACSGEKVVAWAILTTSSTRSLMAVMPSTTSKGTSVVYHARVEIWGIAWKRLKNGRHVCPGRHGRAIGNR